MPKVLLLEDDRELAVSMAEALARSDLMVDVAHTVKDAEAYLTSVVYDLLILDRQLPDDDGRNLCAKLRKSDVSIPVLFVSARTSLEERLEGFESGADDYLTKPFHLAELIARVKALLKRPAQVQPRLLHVRDLVLDLDKHEVIQNGQKINLFPQEFALLEFLARHPGQIFSADALARSVWPTEEESSLETVRTTMMRIRQKIQSSPTRPLIVTLRNIGYRLDP